MQAMNWEKSSIKTNAEVECAWPATLSYEQIFNPMYTTPWEDSVEVYSSDAEVMVTIAMSKFKGLITRKVDRIYGERTRAEGQNKNDGSPRRHAPTWKQWQFEQIKAGIRRVLINNSVSFFSATGVRTTLRHNAWYDSPSGIHSWKLS